MAPAITNKNKDDSKILKFLKTYLSFSFIKSLIFDPAQLWIVSIGILAAEILINFIVVHRVKYTEIDWIAYMQECEGFLNGTLDYSKLRGDTGPLVYPAGFVYIYSGFYYLTSYGKNIRVAQYVFIGIYLMQMALVLRLYVKSRKVPPYVLVVSAFTSYRIHSIYVLRLFNDPIAVLFLYVALNLFMDGKWTVGSIFYSLAVSIKMNILLFAPALLIFYITNLGYLKAFKQLCICAVIQVILGSPFLVTYPLEYLQGAFDLGRIFEHKWTVNYRFLDRSVFEAKYFHFGLLLLHICLLAVFSKPMFQYFQNYMRLRQLQKQLAPQIEAENRRMKKAKQLQKSPPEEKLTEEQEQFLKSFEKGLQKSVGPKQQINSSSKSNKQQERAEKYTVHFDQATQLALLPLFLANFIGIVCARSLHYQFYVWYFHSLPYLAWSTPFSTNVRLLLLFLIELCWNTYPSTHFSSGLLHVCHLLLLVGIGKSMFSNLKTGANVVSKEKDN